MGEQKSRNLLFYSEGHDVFILLIEECVFPAFATNFETASINDYFTFICTYTCGNYKTYKAT